MFARVDGQRGRRSRVDVHPGIRISRGQGKRQVRHIAPQVTTDDLGNLHVIRVRPSEFFPVGGAPDLRGEGLLEVLRQHVAGATEITHAIPFRHAGEGEVRRNRGNQDVDIRGGRRLHRQVQRGCIKHQLRGTGDFLSREGEVTDTCGLDGRTLGEVDGLGGDGAIAAKRPGNGHRIRNRELGAGRPGKRPGRLPEIGSCDRGFLIRHAHERLDVGREIRRLRRASEKIPSTREGRHISTGGHVVAVEGDGLPFTGINLDEGALRKSRLRAEGTIHRVHGRVDSTNGHAFQIDFLTIEVERELGDVASRKRHEGNVTGGDGLGEKGERAIRRDREGVRVEVLRTERVVTRDGDGAGGRRVRRDDDVLGRFIRPEGDVGARGIARQTRGPIGRAILPRQVTGGSTLHDLERGAIDREGKAGGQLGREGSGIDGAGGPRGELGADGNLRRERHRDSHALGDGERIEGHRSGGGIDGRAVLQGDGTLNRAGVLDGAVNIQRGAVVNDQLTGRLNRHGALAQRIRSGDMEQVHNLRPAGVGAIDRERNARCAIVARTIAVGIGDTELQHAIQTIGDTDFTNGIPVVLSTREEQGPLAGDTAGEVGGIAIGGAQDACRLLGRPIVVNHDSRHNFTVRVIIPSIAVLEPDGAAVNQGDGRLGIRDGIVPLVDAEDGIPDNFNVRDVGIGVAGGKRKHTLLHPNGGRDNRAAPQREGAGAGLDDSTGAGDGGQGIAGRGIHHPGTIDRGGSRRLFIQRKHPELRRVSAQFGTRVDGEARGVERPTRQRQRGGTLDGDGSNGHRQVGERGLGIDRQFDRDGRRIGDRPQRGIDGRAIGIRPRCAKPRGVARKGRLPREGRILGQDILAERTRHRDFVDDKALGQAGKGQSALSDQEGLTGITIRQHGGGIECNAALLRGDLAVNHEVLTSGQLQRAGLTEGHVAHDATGGGEDAIDGDAFRDSDGNVSYLPYLKRLVQPCTRRPRVSLFCGKALLVKQRPRAIVIADFKLPFPRITPILVCHRQIVRIKDEGLPFTGVKGNRAIRERRRSREPIPLCGKIAIQQISRLVTVAASADGLCLRSRDGGPRHIHALPKPIKAKLGKRNALIGVVPGRSTRCWAPTNVTGRGEVGGPKGQGAILGDGDGVGGEGAVAVEGVVARDGDGAGEDVLVEGDGLIGGVRAEGGVVAGLEVGQAGRPIGALGGGGPREILRRIGADVAKGALNGLGLPRASLQVGRGNRQIRGDGVAGQLAERDGTGRDVRGGGSDGNRAGSVLGEGNLGQTHLAKGKGAAGERDGGGVEVANDRIGEVDRLALGNLNHERGGANRRTVGNGQKVPYKGTTLEGQRSRTCNGDARAPATGHNVTGEGHTSGRVNGNGRCAGNGMRSSRICEGRAINGRQEGPFRPLCERHLNSRATRNRGTAVPPVVGSGGGGGGTADDVSGGHVAIQGMTGGHGILQGKDTHGAVASERLLLGMAGDHGAHHIARDLRAIGNRHQRIPGERLGVPTAAIPAPRQSADDLLCPRARARQLNHDVAGDGIRVGKSFCPTVFSPTISFSTDNRREPGLGEFEPHIARDGIALIDDNTLVADAVDGGRVGGVPHLGHIGRAPTQRLAGCRDGLKRNRPGRHLDGIGLGGGRPPPFRDGREGDGFVLRGHLREDGGSLLLAQGLRPNAHRVNRAGAGLFRPDHAGEALAPLERSRNQRTLDRAGADGGGSVVNVERQRLFLGRVVGQNVRAVDIISGHGRRIDDPLAVLARGDHKFPGGVIPTQRQAAVSLAPESKEEAILRRAKLGTHRNGEGRGSRRQHGLAGVVRPSFRCGQV